MKMTAVHAGPWLVIIILGSTSYASADVCLYPGHGLHSFTDMTSNFVEPGTSVKYSCDTGYQIFGAIERTCLENGTWTGSHPVCATNIARHRLVSEVSSFIDEDNPERSQSILDDYFSSCSIARNTNSVPSVWTIDFLQIETFSHVQVVFGIADIDLKFTIYYGNSSDSRTPLPIAEDDYTEHPSGLEFEMVTKKFLAYDIWLPIPVSGRFLIVKVMPLQSRYEITLCEVEVHSSVAPTADQCRHHLMEEGPMAVHENLCFSFHRNKNLQWKDARSRCGAYNGSLVTGVTAESQEFLRSSLRTQFEPPTKEDVFWVGGYQRQDFKEEGVTPLHRWLNDTTRQYYRPNDPATGIGGVVDACLTISGPLDWSWTLKSCDSSHRWICQYGIPLCGTPDQRTKTGLEIRSRVIGSKANYSCPEGHILIGEAIRTCLPNGRWSHEAPRCKFVDCGIPEPIANGTVVLVHGTTWYGSVAEYSCQLKNRHLLGSPSRVCQRDGLWTAEIPTCSEGVPDPEKQVSTMRLEVILGVAFGCLLLLLMVTLLIFLIIYSKNRRRTHYIREYERKTMLAKFDSDESIVTNGTSKTSNLIYAYENGKANGNV